MLGQKCVEVRFKIRFYIYLIMGGAGLGLLLGLINADILMKREVNIFFYSKVLICRLLEFLGFKDIFTEYSTPVLKSIAGSDYQLFLQIANNYQNMLLITTAVGAGLAAFAAIVMFLPKNHS